MKTNRFDSLSHEKIDSKAREEAVLKMLAREATAQELAEECGVSPSEVDAWREMYVAGLRQRRAGSVSSFLSSRAVRVASVVGLALVVVVVSRGVVLAASGDCPNGLPFCFAANSPAKASEINENFDQVREWIDQKVGTPGEADATMANVTMDSLAIGAPDAGVADITGDSIDVTGADALYLNSTSGLPVEVGSDLSVGGRLFVDNDDEKPMRLVRFSAGQYQTGYAVSDWVGAIVGFESTAGDIQEDDAGRIMIMRLVSDGTNWVISADFRSHNEAEAWATDVLFIRRDIIREP